MPLPLVAPAGNPYGPLVHFRTQGIFPPTAVYVGPSDSIEFEARSPSVTTTVTVTLRILTPQGEIKEIPQTFVVATVGTGVFTHAIPPTEGFILTAHASADNASRGQCFVKMELIKNPGQGQVLLGALLIQGYLSADDHLSYPQSPTESSLNGAGWVHTIAIANPAAGADWFTQVPSGVRWRVRGLTARLTTSAVAGARAVALKLQDAGVLEWTIIGPANNQGPSQGVTYSWAPGLTPAFVLDQTIGLPADVIMPALFVMQTQTVGMDVGDQWSAIRLLIEEYTAH